jgi:hypothetical protein
LKETFAEAGPSLFVYFAFFFVASVLAFTHQLFLFFFLFHSLWTDLPENAAGAGSKELKSIYATALVLGISTTFKALGAFPAALYTAREGKGLFHHCIFSFLGAAARGMLFLSLPQSLNAKSMKE